MIQKLVDQLCLLVGSQISKESTAVLVDDHFAKASRKIDPSTLLLQQFPIIELNADEFSKTTLRLFKPKSLIFMILTSVADTFDMIKSHCINANPSSIFVFSNTLPGDSINEEKFLVDQLKDVLGPVKATVVYLPLHSVSLLSSESLGCPFEMLELSAPIYDAFPLTLHRINKAAPLRLGSVREVSIDSIPFIDKTMFKRVAHELALSLVFELGLDASKSVYAIGASSKLVGATVQSELASLNDLHSKLLTHRGPSRIRDGASLFADTLSLSFIKRAGLNRILENRHLKPASLILIDRTEDVYTPLCFRKQMFSSLAQRLNVLPTSNRLREPSISALDTSIPNSFIVSDLRAIDEPLYNSLLCDPLEVAICKIREVDPNSLELSELRSTCSTLFDRETSDNPSIEKAASLDAYIDFAINANLNFISTMKAIIQQSKAMYTSPDVDVCLLLAAIFRIESVARYEISESDIDELVPDLSRLFLEIGSVSSLGICNLNYDDLDSINKYRSSIGESGRENNEASLEADDSTISRILQSISDFIRKIFSASNEIGKLRTSKDEPSDDFADMFGQLQNTFIANDASEHSLNYSTPAAAGLIVSLIRDILQSSHIPAALKVSGGLLSFIDNKDPLLKMATAGLSMIWSSVRAAEIDHSPLSEDTIVVFVLGGISYAELLDIVALCRNTSSSSSPKTIKLISNCLVDSLAILEKLC